MYTRKTKVFGKISHNNNIQNTNINYDLQNTSDSFISKRGDAPDGFEKKCALRLR